ncbi:MAG: glycosyl transferase, partial [Thalassovita sp.]|nr:glycosyl transferase [Thalassovita sp.]
MRVDDGAITEGPERLRIEVFGYDVAEISQIRRIRTIRDLGHEVHSFSMRRDNMNGGFRPDWPNTHLFITMNGKLWHRAVIVAASIMRMAGHRARLRAADMLVARNLDMLAIAWAARALARAGDVPLIYECLDINGALCRPNLEGRAMRAAERFLLRRIQMLIVSSPGFIRDYFEPVQGYRGSRALWENKLAAGSALPVRPTPRECPDGEGKIRIGWIGTIRCLPSLMLLAAVADRMGKRVEIHVHGVVHGHLRRDFDAFTGARANMIYHGPYAYPQDLARVYGGCDLVWAQDLWQRGN